MEKKHKIVFAIFSVFIFVGFVIPSTHFPCACLENDYIIGHEVKAMESMLNNYYEDKHMYPSYKEIAAMVKKDELLISLFEYTEKKSSQGVYYKSIDDGKSYTLEGYAFAERVFFDEKVLKKVR